MINSFKVSDVDFRKLDEKNPYFHMIKAIRPRKDLKILDVGCGRERKYQLLDFFLAEGGCLVTGIDLECRNEKINDNLRFIRTSIENFSSKEKFDAAVSSFFFGYVSSDWAGGNGLDPKDYEAKIMKKLHGLLKDGGVCVHYMNEPWHLTKEDVREIGFDILNYPDFEEIEKCICALKKRT